jgi:hypothetical protein
MLLPRALDLIEAGKHMPLPLPKPAIPNDPASKTDATEGKRPVEKVIDGQQPKGPPAKSEPAARARPRS